ncbi:MAG: FHIPEP family type III secretion protein [Hyphomonadaceae bacterium]
MCVWCGRAAGHADDPVLSCWRLRRARRRGNSDRPGQAEAKAAGSAATGAGGGRDVPQSPLAMDDARIEIGFALLPLINDVQGRRPHRPIKALRKTLAQDYGSVMPSVRILTTQLPADAYAIRIREWTQAMAN